MDPRFELLPGKEVPPQRFTRYRAMVSRLAEVVASTYTRRSRTW
jgi:hypothetical protein